LCHPTWLYVYGHDMSILTKVWRWALRPLAIVAILIGIAGFLFSALSANKIKLEETTGWDAYSPSAIKWNLFSATYDLERYIQYRETGQVIIFGNRDAKPYSSVLLVTYFPAPRGRSVDELVLFVPPRYQSQPTEILRNVVTNLKARESLADIQRDASEVYQDLFGAGAAMIIFVLLLPKIAVIGRRIPFSIARDIVVREWRKLLILGSVLWAVFATWEMSPNRSSDYAIIVGPFAIAITLYFLFPKQGEKGERNPDSVRSSNTQ